MKYSKFCAPQIFSDSWSLLVVILREINSSGFSLITRRQQSKENILVEFDVFQAECGEKFK